MAGSRKGSRTLWHTHLNPRQPTGHHFISSPRLMSSCRRISWPTNWFSLQYHPVVASTTIPFRLLLVSDWRITEHIKSMRQIENHDPNHRPSPRTIWQDYRISRSHYHLWRCSRSSPGQSSLSMLSNHHQENDREHPVDGTRVARECRSLHFVLLCSCYVVLNGSRARESHRNPGVSEPLHHGRGRKSLCRCQRWIMSSRNNDPERARKEENMLIRYRTSDKSRNGRWAENLQRE